MVNIKGLDSIDANSEGFPPVHFAEIVCSQRYRPNPANSFQSLEVTAVSSLNIRIIFKYYIYICM